MVYRATIPCAKNKLESDEHAAPFQKRSDASIACILWAPGAMADWSEIGLWKIRL